MSPFGPDDRHLIFDGQAADAGALVDAGLAAPDQLSKVARLADAINEFMLTLDVVESAGAIDGEPGTIGVEMTDGSQYFVEVKEA